MQCSELPCRLGQRIIKRQQHCTQPKSYKYVWCISELSMWERKGAAPAASCSQLVKIHTSQLCPLEAHGKLGPIPVVCGVSFRTRSREAQVLEEDWIIEKKGGYWGKFKRHQRFLPPCVYYLAVGSGNILFHHILYVSKLSFKKHIPNVFRFNCDPIFWYKISSKMYSVIKQGTE